jgi:hypothetical protein
MDDSREVISQLREKKRDINVLTLLRSSGREANVCAHGSSLWRKSRSANGQCMCEKEESCERIWDLFVSIIHRSFFARTIFSWKQQCGLAISYWHFNFLSDRNFLLPAIMSGCWVQREWRAERSMTVNVLIYLFPGACKHNDCTYVTHLMGIIWLIYIVAKCHLSRLMLIYVRSEQSANFSISRVNSLVKGI